MDTSINFSIIEFEINQEYEQAVAQYAERAYSPFSLSTDPEARIEEKLLDRQEKLDVLSTWESANEEYSEAGLSPFANTYNQQNWNRITHLFNIKVQLGLRPREKINTTFRIATSISRNHPKKLSIIQFICLCNRTPHFTEPNLYGLTGLFLMIKEGHRDYFDPYFNGAKEQNKDTGINTKNDKGQTPLYAAIIKQTAFYTKKLIENGADYTIKNNMGENPLRYAERISKSSGSKLFPGYDYLCGHIIKNFNEVCIDPNNTILGMIPQDLLPIIKEYVLYK